MNKAQKRDFINKHLFYELRMLLGAAKVVEHFDKAEMGNVCSLMRDSLYVHSRNLYNFFQGCAKNDATIHDFIDKSFDVSLYLKYKTELHEAVLHIKKQRLKKKKTSSKKLALNKVVIKFAEDIKKLWQNWIDLEKDMGIKKILKANLDKACKEANGDLKIVENKIQKKYKNGDDFFEFIKSGFDVVKSEVSNLSYIHSRVQKTNNTLKNGKNQPNSDFDLLKQTYISYMVMAICRQVDARSDVSSLINIINEIHQHGSEFITKEWYSSQYEKLKDPKGLEGWHKSMGEDDFEEFSKYEVLDLDKIKGDSSALINATKGIKKFRNKRIAHRDKDNNFKFDVNFNDLSNAVDVVDKLTVKYVALLEQASMVDGTMMPTVQ